MQDEKPKLTMPHSHIRDTAIEIEKHNMSAPIHVPKTHDDYLGIRKAAHRHHEFKE